MKVGVGYAYLVVIVDVVDFCKMLIGVDLDEVLADLMSQLIVFHNHRYGTRLRREDFESYNLWEIWGGTKQDATRKVREFYCSEYFRGVLPVKGSVRGMDFLIERGYKPIILTSRYGEGVRQTMPWLGKYFRDKFFGIIFSDDYIDERGIKKAELCERLRVEFMVDDDIGVARSCAKKGTRVFLLNYPWNQLRKEELDIERVDGWEEIVEKIKRSSLR